jgi:hypothetical protein
MHKAQKDAFCRQGVAISRLYFVMAAVAFLFMPLLSHGHDYQFFPTFTIESAGKQSMNLVAGEEVALTFAVINADRRQADAMFIIQILDEDGVAKSVQISNATILPDTYRTEITNAWIPQQDGFVFIEGFLWDDDGSGYYALSPKLEGTLLNIELKQNLEYHDLTLELDFSQRVVVAGRSINGSLYLVNNSDHPESITVDGIYEWMSPALSCYNPHVLYEPITIPAGGKLNLANDSVDWGPRHPGIYNFTKFAVLSVKNPDGKVGCLRIGSNTVTADVTAPPSPDGVKLVLHTDKHVYHGNETIPLNLYIENNSGTPFKLSEVVLSAYVKDSTGKEVTNTGTLFADYSNYPTIAPHSQYDLNGFLSWNQRTYLDTGQPVPIGEYFIEVEFWSPFLKSNSHKITIE